MTSPPYAILHIPSGSLYIDSEWDNYAYLTKTHLEYFIHAFNHTMVPMNQYARNFSTWCQQNNISPGLDEEFDILLNYTIKIIDVNTEV